MVAVQTAQRSARSLTVNSRPSVSEVGCRLPKSWTMTQRRASQGGNVPRNRSVGRAACGAQNPHGPRAREPGAAATTRSLRRRSKRPQFKRLERLFWVWLSDQWAGWREALHVVRPQTVIRWHRQGFRAFWTWKSRRGRVGRPRVISELAELVRTMALANPLWGSPRIHGELLKLGLEVSQRTVARLMPRRP